MKRQSKLFFGPRPARRPVKDGENPSVPERRFGAMDPSEIEIRFNNRTATQFGGYSLFASFLERFSLKAAIARFIKMCRGPLGFTAPEISLFLIVAKVLGAARLMHVETMRRDPMLTLMFGIEGLPSGKTIGKYLKSFTEGHLGGLAELTKRVFHQCWKSHYHGKAKPEIILDYDSTTLTTYGRQEGADRGRSFRKKDKPGFQPKFAFVGGLGVMVHQRLEPQSHNLNQDFISFHEETVRKLPKRAKIRGIRGDGALYSFKMVAYCEKRKYLYAFTAQRTPGLQRALLDIPDDAWEEGLDDYGRPYSIARIRYCPKSWDQNLRTYIVSRRLKDDPHQGRLFKGEEYKYFAYITNYRGPLLSQYQFCVERCSLENFVKEAKGGFSADFLPCKEENANKAYLAHVQLAFNLAIFFKWDVAPPGVNRWTVATLRSRILCICGNIRQNKNTYTLSLPTWWPYQTEFRKICRRLDAA